MDKLFLEYADRKIEYCLEKGKRKNLYIVIKEDGNVEVRAPKRMPDKDIFKFLDSKKNWVYKKVVEKQNISKQKQLLKNDGKLKLLGKIYDIDKSFEDVKKVKVELKDECVKIKLPLELERVENVNDIVDVAYDKLLNNIAEKEVRDSMKKITELVGLEPKELKIRNFKRAWGNCSSKKVISINKDVCKFSKNAIDYVCLHEVCHLKYMNHSKDFWNMVSLYMPDYKIIQKELI